MCGIAGIWNPDLTAFGSGADLADACSRMTERLAHRGPDGSGIWSEAESGLSLGHRRLTIIDLSDTGSQPMSSANGRWTLTFNGEIYNFRPLRKELEASGARFRGTSDSEVLVEAIARWGVEAALGKCRGMFAFAVWDSELKQLTLARDRVGEKPLYVATFRKTLLFASELQALSWLWPECRNVNPDAVWDLLNFGYVCGDKSILAGIEKVPPASYVTIDRDFDVRGELDAARRARAYWQVPDLSASAAVMEADPVEELDAILKRVVREQLVADVPVGAFLSGGIDSSLVVSVASQVSDSPVNTFTVGYDEPSFDESPWARRIAELLSTNHHEIVLSESDLLGAIPDVCDTYDEPFADPSQIPTYLVSRFASSHVKVALTGDGGDELFCGYNRYTQFSRANRAINALPRLVRKPTAALLKLFPEAILEASVSRLRALVGQAAPLQSYGARFHKLARLLELDTVQDRYMSLLSTSAPVALMPGYVQRKLSGLHLSDDGKLEDDLMLYDLRGYLPDNGLVKLDRASMRNGLECRSPLLDRDVLAFSRSLPLNQKIRNGKGKWILRQLLGRYLPEDTFERPKAGFSVPIAQWLRGSLAEWLKDSLAGQKIRERGILDAAVVSRIIREHQAGSRDHSRLLWSMLMLENWLVRHEL